MSYECIKTFTSFNNVMYRLGNEISIAEYDKLFPQEKTNFKYKVLPDSFIPEVISSLPEFPTNYSDWNTPDISSSNDSFGGFDGGDFGGGGASGNW